MLFFYDPAAYDRRSASILLVSAGMLLCGALFYRTAYRHYGGMAPGLRGAPPQRSCGRLSLNKADVFCMLAITALYGCFALYDLGEREAPVTCLEEDAAACSRAAECRTLPVWKGLDRVINEYLDGITIADLIRRGEAGNDYVI